MSKKRCPWVNLKSDLSIEYHDKEWGRPVTDDIKHFEMITLEGAQAGLSWDTVLNKRERYREVFYGFDPKKVSKIKEDKIKKLLEDPGIIRNKLKVNSTVTNAKAFLEVQKEFGSFNSYIWSFFEDGIIYNSPKTIEDYDSRTELSDRISKDLKKEDLSL